MPGAVGGDQARRRAPPRVTSTAPTPWSTSVPGRGGGRGRVGSRRPPRRRRRTRRAPRRWASSGRARPRASAATRAASGPSLVSTATRAGVLRSERHELGVPAVGSTRRQRAGQHHPGGAGGAVEQRSRRGRRGAVADTVAPGLLSLVVVPSGSVMVRLMRTSPAGGAGRQRCRPPSSSGDERVVGPRAGSTASVPRPADTAAREMFTPLPPACMVTDSSRWTAPRSSGPARVTVRSLLGLGVRVTIMRRVGRAHTATPRRRLARWTCGHWRRSPCR